jgi:hypothetical protein
MKLSTWRRILFWTFTGAFLATATLVLLLAFGYRFSFERGVFVYTGSITLKVTPLENIELALDGKPLDSTFYNFINGSITVPGITPGTHTLTLSSPGYQSWTQEVRITSGIATEFWNILLSPSTVPANLTTTLPRVERVFLSPDTDLVALLRTPEGSNTIEVDILRLSTNRTTPAYRSTNMKFDANRDENTEWSGDATYLSIPVLNAEGESETMLVNLATNTAETLATEKGLPHTDVRWGLDDSDSLLSLQNDSLLRTDRETRASATLGRDILDYDISQNAIYTVTTVGLNKITSMTTGMSTLLYTFGAPLESSHQYKLTVYDETRMLLRNTTTGDVTLYDTRSDTLRRPSIGSPVLTKQFSDDGKKLLLGTASELYVWYLVDWEVQPVRPSGTLDSIVRYSAPVASPIWLLDYEHVLYAVGDGIRYIGLDKRDTPIITPVNIPTAPTRELILGGDRKLFIIGADGTLTTTTFPVYPPDMVPAN